MANPSALKSLDASSHPLGNEVDIRWVLPDSLPSNYRVDIFKKEGSDITQEEIDAIMGSGSAEGVTVIQPTIEYHGVRDLEVQDGKTYYYKGIVVNTDTNEYSSAVGNNAVPDWTAKPDITDLKALVLEAVRRVFRSREVVLNKDIFVRKDHNVQYGQFPVVTVTRLPNSVVQEFIGKFMGDQEASVLGHLEQDAVIVTWSDVPQGRRDKLTLLFRSAKWEMWHYLEKQAGIEAVDISFGQDSVDERFRNDYVAANSLTIRGVIQSTEEYPPTGERGYPLEVKEQPVTT